MTEANHAACVDILLVEDNPADVRLVREALKETQLTNDLHVVKDGEEALAFLHRTGQYEQAARPGLIVLDLNLPKKHGREVLAEIKTDGCLKRIPVVVLSTSVATGDVNQAYSLHANCHVRKPIDFEEFVNVVRSLGDFWLTVATLPCDEPK